MPARKRKRTTTRKRRRQTGGAGGFAVAKGVTSLVGRIDKDKEAKKALTENLGSKLKRAWINLRGLHPDPNKGKAHYTPKKPKGCKVLTRSVDGRGRHLLAIKRASQHPSTSINDATATSTTSLPGEHSQGIQSIQTSSSVATCQQRSNQRGQRNGTESIEE